MSDGEVEDNCYCARARSQQSPATSTTVSLMYGCNYRTAIIYLLTCESVAIGPCEWALSDIEQVRPYSDRTKEKAKKIKTQAEKIREKTAIIKGIFCVCSRFRLL